MLLASERSEQDTYRDNKIKNRDVCWRASETVLGVDNAKSGICYYWWASVASETLTGVKMKKSGMFVYLYICLDVCMSFCTLTLRIFVFVPRSTPSQTSLNRILRFSDHYPYHLRNWIVYGFELFCGCSSNSKSYGSSISIRVSGGDKLMCYLSQL